MLSSPENDEYLPTEASPLVMSRESSPSRWSFHHILLKCMIGATTTLMIAIGLLVVVPSHKDDVQLLGAAREDMRTIKVAFAGNSMQYYHDLPRLLEHMLQMRYDTVIQDSCFQGLSTITSLWLIGNTVNETLHTQAAMRPDGTYDVGSPTIQALLAEQDWDFLVLNDYTQGPARLSLRNESIVTLKTCYAPILRDMGTTLVFLETAAYEYPGIQQTQDLGDFDEFSRRTHEGYEEYVEIMCQQNCSARLAPSGMASSYIRNHIPDMFHMLYAQDHHHPSPHGTWLEACVVYCTITGEIPPRYQAHWWNTARYIQPGLDFPTDEEAEEIRHIAGHVCGLTRRE